MSRPSFASRSAAAANVRTRTGLKVAPHSLRVGDVGDHFEHEADRMADLFTSGSTVRRDWSLARVSADTASRPLAGGVAPTVVNDVLASPGKPLDESARAKFEVSLQHDLSQVRIHADDKAAESAESVKALAYTVGNDVVFGRGQFHPGSSQGDRLLAHELAHTLQQEHTSQPILQRQGGPEKRETPSPPPQPAAAPTTASAQVDVRSWPAKLPRAQRKGRQEQIQKVPNKLELSKTAIGGQALDVDQQAIVDKIKVNRERAISYPWLKEVHEYKRTGLQKGDTKGGFQYGGERAPKQAGPQNPYADAKRRQLWDTVHAELGGEGASISAVNTYDNAWVTLGRGLTGAYLSRAMEEFLAKDEAARNMFLDLGALFAGGKLMVVNTDNGAVEEDVLKGNLPQMNARMLFAVNRALVSLYIYLAEQEEHAKHLLPALQKNIPAFSFPQRVVDKWNDMKAVALAAHLVSFGATSWDELQSCDGDVKKIVRTYARNRGEDSAHGDARFYPAADAGVILKLAGGKAKEALDSPAAVDLGASIPAGSQKGKVLFQEKEGSTRYHIMTM